MSKILAQGMITLTQLYEGVQVILTPTAVLIPCDSEETPKPNAYINASTNVKAFLGTMDITSGITLGELEYSDSTVKASKTGTKVSITAITTRTGYVDIPVSATINGETIDLGKHRFNFVKQIDGQPGIPGDPGFGYTLNIKGGVRGVAYAANGTNPEPKTSSQFSVELLKNGVKVANPASISWTCGGNLSGASSVATFTPTIKSTYNSESSYVKVSVKEFAASLAVEETIPIICTKHADGLDWINEWNNQYVQVGTEKIITPKIFAGTKNSANELTGVAIGRDVLGGNANKVIGIVGYKKNTPVFSLDQDANFFVSSSGSAGDVKNGTNNAKGLYFDGNDLYISGRVRINGGSTIGENNTSVEEVINNSNLGAQANNKIDNLSIGGRNLALKTSNNYSTAYSNFNGSTNICPSLAKVLTDGLKVGDTVTVRLLYKYTNIVATSGQTATCWIQGNGNVTAWNSGAFHSSSKKAISGSGEHEFKYSFTVIADHLKNEFWSTNIRHDYVQSGSVQWKLLKIEKGNKATDWSPAPEDLENAYTIILTNEAQVIPTDSSRKPTSSATYSTDIQVYKGSTQRTDYTIGTINSANGITVSKTSSRVNFAVSTGTALTADGGYFTIPIAIDGKTFNKTFSWSCSKQGVKGDTGGDGQDAQYVILNGDQVFKYSNNFTGAPTPENIKIQATAYGISNPKYTWEFKRSGETSWNTISSATNNNQNYYTLPHDNSTIFNNSSVKSVTIRCTVNGHSDEITIVKVSDGAKGDTGVAGNGINTITEYYAVSSSNTTAPTSWSTTVPSMTSTNKYLWNYEVIRYTDNTTKETAKRVIGAYGDKGATGSTGATGATGNGISNITNYYLASPNSSGITTSSSGWTTSVQSVSSSKKYLWNYEAIAYTNGSTNTTTPCIIGVYGDKGDNAKAVSLTSSSQVFKSTDGGLTFAPDNIVITPNYQNVSYSKWQYSINGGSSWTDVSSSTNGVAYSSTSLTLSKSSTLFTNTATSIIFKIITNNSSVTDTITIVRLYDVTDLKIGATNYLRQSGDYSSPYWGNKGATITNEYYMGSKVYKVNAKWGAMAYKKNKELELEPEMEYILSAYIKKDSGITYDSGANMSWYGLSVNTAVVALDNLTTSWKQYSVKRKGKEITVNGDGAGIRIEPNKAITGGYIYVAGIQIEKGNKATDWKPAQEDVNSNINDVKNSLNSFQNTVNTTFKDGIIEQAEAKAIARHIQILDTEKVDVDKEYSIIYNNSVLSGTAKTNLASAKTEFDNAHTSLKSTINTAIADGKVTSSEKTSVDSTFSTYNSILGTYKQRVQEALDAISSAKVDNIQIGGRNLLLNSDNGYLNNLAVYNNTNVVYSNVNGWRKMTFTNQLNNEIVHDKWFTPTQLGNYTFSIMCRTDATSITTSVSVFTPENGHRYVPASVENLGNGLYRIVSSFSISNLNRIRVVDLQNFKTVGATYVEFRYPMLEIGNKASAWSQAPEDIDQQLTNIKTDLQTQVDGKIDTWSQETPDPASGWTTSDEKLKHKGDIWYKPTSKETYRYTGTSWERLYDKVAENATNIANQKRRVFVSTPTTPYDVGDLWINNEELYRCKTALSSGSYNSGHWVKAVKYTDDSVAQSAKNDLQAFKKLDEWLVINNELDTYFPFDNNLQTTGGTNPNSGYNAYLTPQGKFGNCLSIQEDVVNLFAFNNISELNVQGDGNSFATIKISDEEVVCKYKPSSSTGLAYRGKDIAVDTQRTYTLSGWMYVSENYNSTSAPAIRGEQGFGRVLEYNMNKKGQWQFFSHTMKPSSGTARILLYPRRTNSSADIATTGYVLYKNVQFTQTGAVHMFYNGTKPKDTISYEVSQPDVSTMMAYKKHVLDSNFKHQALVKNGSTFTFYENGVATTNYVNKWKVYACEGITTPGTDGKNIDKYNKPLSTQLTTDLTGIGHSWQATGYGYVYRTFLYCSQAKTVTLMINFDNAGCAYCNGVLAGQGGYNANGNACVFNLVKGWNCIELACVDADTGGGLKYVASGSDGLFSSNKTSHPEILYMTAELPIEMANNKVTYFSRANCFVDEAVFLNKAITQEEAKTYVGSGKRLTDPATIIDVPEPTNVTFSFS